MKSVFSIVGALIAIYPKERYGRKPLILAIQITFVGACILEYFATTWLHWMGARILDVRPGGRHCSRPIAQSQGVANGINASVLNVYVAEISPTAARGAMLATYSLRVRLLKETHLTCSTPLGSSSAPSSSTLLRDYHPPSGDTLSFPNGRLLVSASSFGSFYPNPLDGFVKRGGTNKPRRHFDACTRALLATMWTPNMLSLNEKWTLHER